MAAIIGNVQKFTAYISDVRVVIPSFLEAPDEKSWIVINGSLNTIMPNGIPVLVDYDTDGTTTIQALENTQGINMDALGTTLSTQAMPASDASDMFVFKMRRKRADAMVTRDYHIQVSKPLLIQVLSTQHDQVGLDSILMTLVSYILQRKFTNDISSSIYLDADASFARLRAALVPVVAEALGSSKVQNGLLDAIIQSTGDPGFSSPGTYAYTFPNDLGADKFVIVMSLTCNVEYSTDHGLKEETKENPDETYMLSFVNLSLRLTLGR